MMIDELIADAKAEETVVENTNKNFNQGSMSLDINDLVAQRCKMVDYERIIGAVIANASLNWNKKGMTTDGDEIMNTFKVLFPDVYDNLLADLKAKEPTKEEE